MRKSIPHIINLQAQDNYQLYVSFDDGVSGTIDLSKEKNLEVFNIWNDENVFKKVFLSNHGSIAWNDDVEIDLLNVYLTLSNQTFENYACS